MENKKRMISEDELECALKESGMVNVVDYDRDGDIQGAIIGQRDLIIEGTNLTDDHKREINEITNAVLIKLGALRHHVKAFEAHLQQARDKIAKDERRLCLIRQGAVFFERELAYEFDGYIYQFKSALDMLVKVLGLVFDGNPKIPQSYADSGDGVVKYLRKKKDHYQRQKKLNSVQEQRIDRLIELIESARDPWLKPLIAWRDTVTHFNPVLTIGFAWDAQTNALREPMANISGKDRPLLEVLEEQISKAIRYSAEFIGRSLSCAFPADVELSPLDESRKTELGESWKIDMTYARYEAVRRTVEVSIEIDGREIARLKPPREHSHQDPD